MYDCPRCGKKVNKLFFIDDAESSAEDTKLLGFESPTTYCFCLTCTKEYFDISDKDLIEEEISLLKNTKFQLNLLKGNIAQSIIETIFQEFGYEVYPYGYESYLTNIIKHMKKGNSNVPVMKIRSTPDLYIYDRAENEGFLVEVKASNTPNESEYWIRKYTVDKYLKYWEEAILIIYCIISNNIYCCPIGKIPFENLEITKSFSKEDMYVINLKENFVSLPEFFSRIDKEEYNSLIKDIKEILNKFSQNNK